MKRSPIVKSIEWGEIVLEDGATYKDAILFPGGHTNWDWKKNDTHHVPGVKINDVYQLIENGAEEIILTLGYELVLQVTPEVEIFLKEKGLNTYVMETGQAVELYNKMVNDGIAVGILIHSTC